MSQKMFRRMLAAFLAFVMILSITPLSEIVANAATTITTVDDMGKLGSGFNMLGDKYLGDAPMRQIFVGTSGVTAQFDSNPKSTSSYSYITSVSDYFSNEAQTIKVGFGMGSEASAKLTIKIVELNLSQKYKLDVSTTNGTTSSESGSDSTEYMLLEYTHQIGTYTMWLDNTTQISRLWQTDDDGNFTVLHEDFINSLLTDDPAVFFQTYGTHLITQYTAGGTATSSYYGEIHYESSSGSFAHNTSVSESAEGALAKHSELESIYESGSGSSSSSTIKRGESMARGGTGNFAWDEASASSWATTVDQDHHIALVDDNLMMLPMWELLIDDSQADRRIELEQYFNENVDAQYAELYGKYIYSPTDHMDWSGYTFIQTAEDFDNIRNDLDGKYVLLNEIDLSAYSEWTPIGTKEAPFTGTIDGNGNTISGLNITECDSYAGLLGYNAGIVENLTVSGNIDADGTGSANNAAYIGGIAGYNAGTIYNCRNLVTINGKLSVTDAASEDSSAATNDFFTTYSALIESAKNTSAETVTDNTTVSVGLVPVHLSGTATGVTIDVTGSSSNDPAIIVLEDANITGTITHTGDRKICIVSIGEANAITGCADTIAIDAENSDLYFTGNAALTITGGKGSDGAAGNNGTNRTDSASTGSDGAAGGSGKNGKNGNAGATAIKAYDVYISIDNQVAITGGSGGNGGAGGNGGYGQKGGDSTWSMWDSSTWGDGGDGGDGGNGGNGGDGGSGAYAITANTIICYSDNVVMRGGDSGDSGKGGNGGAGGNGGTASSDGKSGGDGGVGGKGGNSGNVPCASTALSSTAIIKAFNSGKAHLLRGITGNVANAGTKGLGGDKGVWNGGWAAWGYDGEDGDDGKDGSTGTRTDFDASSAVCKLISPCTHYILYTAAVTYETAITLSNDAESKLVSIGSEAEQLLVAEMLTASGNTDLCFWIGLEILSYDASTQTAICQWADGARIKLIGTGADAVAYRIDTEGNVIGEAYVNFNSGEPNNYNNNEFYVHLTTGATWNDNSASTTYGYITEIGLEVETGNTPNQNALVIGGICGYNAGTVKEAYNTETITADKAYSLQSGISAYAGGISGFNNGIIADSVNTGKITALAMSDSMSHYADAYAYNIAAGGTITNCSAAVTTVANAYSANTLENPQNDSAAVLDGVQATLDAYWKNSELTILAVNQTEYLRNCAFIKDTLELRCADATVNAYTVRYNFYQCGTATVTLQYSDGINKYVRYIPIHVIAESPEAVQIYMMPDTEFIVGDEFSCQGLALKLVYDNGREKLLAAKVLSVSQPDMTVIGTQTITVSYTYTADEIFTCSYDIYVAPLPTFTVSYDANGGTGAPDAQTKTRDTDLILHTGKPARPGYTFLGWSVSAEATVADYQPGDCFTVDADTVLYAVWTLGCENEAHTFIYEVQTEPTLTDSGSVLCTCQLCGATDTIVLPALNETDYAYAVLQAPTCLEDGAGRYSWTRDEQTFGFDVAIPATGHSHDAVVTEPSCTEGGYTTHTCHCGDTYVDSYTDPLGHSYVDGSCEHCGEADPVLIGDANGDGVINHLDAMLIAQYYVNAIDEDAIVLSAADVNGDGAINHLDAMLVAQYYVGAINEFAT